MTKRVILDFSKCAFRDAGLRAGGRVTVNPDIMEWLEDNNRGIPKEDMIDWYLGRDVDAWRVGFVLKDEPTAVLFKLTFGGA